jgi:hypothetical protein
MGTKKNIHTLSSATQPDFFLLGISSHENDYRISWALNNMLGLKLIKAENHKSLNKRLGETQEFSMYIGQTDEFSPIYKLISNRCDNGFLLEELKNIDYILRIEPFEAPIDIDSVFLKIKEIQLISAIFRLNPQSIKSISRLA